VNRNDSNVMHHMLVKQMSSEFSDSDVILRQGWVFSKRTCVFSGIQFTRYFIEFVVVETKQIVSGNSNMMLTRQPCGQRSDMAAARKRRALAFYFSVRICFQFPIRIVEESRI